MPGTLGLGVHDVNSNWFEQTEWAHLVGWHSLVLLTDDLSLGLLAASETLRSFFLVVFKGLLFLDFSGNLDLQWLINLFNGFDVSDYGLGVMRQDGGVL